MLRDGARRFVREQYDFEARRGLSRSEVGHSSTHWKTFAELGWLALGIPEDAGGLGCSFNETAILLEEFGRGLVLEPFVSTAVLCVRILDRCENADVRLQVLAEVTSGEAKLALAHDEPASRFEPGRAATSARAHGDGFVLNGTKMLVVDGPSADRYIVSATVDDDPAPSLFLVPNDVPGLTLGAYPLIDGGRAADLRFADVACPAAARLAGPQRATDILEEAFDAATVARIAEAIGAMEAAMAVTNEYIKTRVQFGQPIGKFQALQHRMAEMFIEVEKSRSSLFRALAHLDAETVTRKAAVSAAKVVVAAAGKFVGGQGIQLHGGMGMTEECSVGHYFKKLMAFDKLYGDSDWHLLRYAACNQ
ncbi:acyl-CoA dehydrogenase family protein [Aromatoleum petrolei]|nr:acyl-CoA dehydrogenase family protein [Aromatoleum petrolei]